MPLDDPIVYLAALALAALIFGVGKWIVAVNADRTSFKGSMKEVRDDLETILSRLPPRVVTGESPIRDAREECGRPMVRRRDGRHPGHTGARRRGPAPEGPFTTGRDATLAPGGRAAQGARILRASGNRAERAEPGDLTGRAAMGPSPRCRSLDS